jgi:hypothetical protein
MAQHAPPLVRQPPGGQPVPEPQHHPVSRGARAPSGQPDSDVAAPAQRTGRRGIVFAALAAAVAVAIGTAVLSWHGFGGSAGRGGQAGARSLSLPPKIGGYSSGPQSAHVTLTSAEPFVSAAKTAVYQLSGPGQPGGLLVGSIGIDVGHLSGISPGAALSRIYGDFDAQVGRLAAAQSGPGQAAAGQPAVGPPQPVPAGSLGGMASCWQVTVPSVTGSGRSAGASCGWADSDTFGFLFAPGLSTSRLASTLLMFRSAIEIQSH